MEAEKQVIKNINLLDGSKVALMCMFLLAAIAMIFIGWHLLAADGPDSLPEIGFLEHVVDSVLVAGAGVSTIHVVTGAVSTHLKNKQELKQKEAI